MKKIVLLVLVFINGFGFAQSKDPNKILKAVETRFNKVRDYQANVSVKLDMDFVKVPESKAKLYFKQPDKVKIESTGFAMLPKQSVNFSPAQFLKGNFTALYVRNETVNNKNLDVIKIIPNSDTTDVILTTVWVDQAQSVITKVETSTKKGGTIQIDFVYDPKTIPLPTTLKFSFNLGDVQIPASVENAQSNQNDKHDNRRSGTAKLKGSVIMTYSDYKINTGIPDSFFDEKKK